MRKLVTFAIVVCLAAFLGSGAWPEITISQVARPAAAGDSFLSIPACDFNEYSDDYDFALTGPTLYINSGTGIFSAPVNLPSGSTIKKIILVCYDNGAGYVALNLRRISLKASDKSIVTNLSSGSESGYRAFSKRLTSYEIVNNWRYSYYLALELSAGDYAFSHAKIVYSSPSP